MKSLWVDVVNSTVEDENPGKALEVKVTSEGESALQEAMAAYKGAGNDQEAQNHALIDLLKLVAEFGTPESQEVVQGYLKHVQEQTG